MDHRVIHPKPALACVLVCLALAVPAAAQTPAPAASIAAPEDALSELVVIAHPPGPAMWRITRGDSSVIILGAVTPVPHRLVWDQRQVDAALTGANVLLSPPKPDLGPAQILGLITTQIWKVRQGQDLEKSLPPALRARFVDARTRAYAKPDRYAHWKPALAGFLLLSDFRRHVGLSEAKPASTVQHSADEKHVRQEALGAYRMSLLLQIAGRLTPEGQLACLSDALDELDFEAAHPQDIDDDWARGDIRAVAARYRGSAVQKCLLRAPGAREIIDQEMGKAVDRLWDALQKPGKSVAVIDLAWMLPQGGVLDRLKAKGAMVGAPAALAE
jgi:hypothetical protein